MASEPPEALPQRSAFDREFSQELKAEVERLGLSSPTLDLSFVVFVRLLSRFGVFSAGPITIGVDPLEEALAHIDQHAEDGGGFTRLFEALAREVRRTGSKRPNELHYLLAFMRVAEGLPARVFGELGVSPEDVERSLRGGDTPASERPGRLYSPEQAAEYLGVKVETVRAWIRSGHLRASRLAGQRVLRIREHDLEAVLEPVRPDETK